MKSEETVCELQHTDIMKLLVFCLCTSTIEPASRASVECSIPLLSLPRKEEKGKPPSTAIVKYLYLLRFLSFKPVFIHVKDLVYDTKVVSFP